MITVWGHMHIKKSKSVDMMDDLSTERQRREFSHNIQRDQGKKCVCWSFNIILMFFNDYTFSATFF